MRKKYDTVVEIVKTFDIFLSESKLNNFFPINQFHVRGYKFFRHNHNHFGDGLILYIKENIPCKPLTDRPSYVF